MPTVLPRLSKACTALLLDQTEGDTFVDYSQYRTNLLEQHIDPSTDWLDEPNSTRTAIDGSREISLVWNIQSGQTGVLIDHGSNSTTYSYRIDISGTLVRCRIGGSTVLSASLPGVVVGTEYRFLISWNQRPSGANYRSELYLYNLTLGGTNFVFVTGTHSSVAPSPTDKLSVGAAFGGASPFSGGLAFLQVRIGRRFHSTTEQFNDFVSETTPPTFTARRRTPLLTYPTSELPIAGEGEFAGPAYLWAAAATRQASMRLVTPLVNVVARSPYSEDNTYGPVRYFRAAPDDARYHWSVRYLWQAFTSPKTNRVRVRVHTHASGGGGSIATVYLRMYSVRNLQLLGPNLPQPMSWVVSDTATITAPQSAPGGWVDLGTMQIARDDAGLTYFVLGFSFGLDAGGLLEPATRLKINAVQIEPFHLEAEGNGFDNDLEGQG